MEVNWLHLTCLKMFHFKMLYCYESSLLTSVNVSQCKQLQDLQCYKCALRAIDVTNNVNLLRLNCDDNKLVLFSMYLKILSLLIWIVSANKIKVHWMFPVILNLLILPLVGIEIRSINLQKNTALNYIGNLQQSTYCIGFIQKY
jgi:hypothetical protein